MQERDYIDILVESLKKKVEILNHIIEANEHQRVLILDETLGPDDFSNTIDEKAKLIDELEKLDSGFEQLFQRVKPIIEEHKSFYTAEIKQMQDMIKIITDKTVQVQQEEKRNKQLIEQKFSNIKKQIREVKSSQKAVNTYYKDVMKRNFYEAQFYDSKK